MIGFPITDDERLSLTTRLFEHLDARTTDLAPSRSTYAASEYFDEELAQRERERIFGQVPVLVAHGSELAEAGDFVVMQMPNNEAVVIRQPDGSVRSFVNTCRHRGARLVSEGSGSATLLTCGYHGWAYNRDGTLRSVANGSTFGDVDKSCLGLTELPTQERHGFVWMVDSPDSVIDVEKWLGADMDTVLASYNFTDFRTFRHVSLEEPINWKVLMDAFVDGYHIAATHGGSVAPYFYNNIIVCDILGSHARYVTPRKSIDSIRSEPAGSVSIAPHVTVAHFLMPNLSILMQPDHFEILTFTPHPRDVGRCRMDIRLLAPEGEMTDQFTRRWDRNWDILMAVLRDEDLVMNRQLQDSVRNRATGELHLGRNEIVNQLFHRELERIRGDI